MKTKLLFMTILFAFLGMQVIYGQDNKSTPNAKPGVISRFVHNDNVAFKLDYFGELALHPGLILGVDYTVARKNWMTIHWDIELGGYWHRWNHTALFLKTSMGTRFPIGSLFVDLNLGVGYMHSFVAGTVYQKSPDGGLEKATNRGHSHFMPNTSFLIGWDGTRRKKLPWTIHFGPEVYLQSSFNHIFLPHVAVKVGFTYKFKN